MNVNKNTMYYANLGVFILLAVYSLLFSINAFNFENMDLNAGLCAVVVIMVIALLMYLVQATRIALVLYSMPIAKVMVEIISTLILLTIACVIRIYCVDEFVLYIAREGIILGCMFMAYLIARMLNQYGFITLLVLAPWPFVLNTSYELDMAQLIVMAEVMAILLVVTFVLYMVRQQKKFKNTMMGVFVVAVVGFLVYAMYSQGNQIVQVANPMQYISMYDSVLALSGVERYYYIGIITAAILGAIRMWFGKGTCNTLVAFAASAALVTMTVCGLGGQYIYMLYPILAIVASGSCGTRPLYLDEEVQLNDNLEGVSDKPKKKKVETSYKDETELDNMLDELENNKPYNAGGHFNPVKFASDNADEELPIELQMYDFGDSSTPASIPEVKKEEKVVEEKPTQPTPVEVKQADDVEVSVKEVVEEKIAETAEQVAEQVTEEVAEVVAATAVVEEVIEVVDEVAMETETTTETIEEPVAAEPVDTELVVAEPVIAEPVVEAPVVAEPVVEAPVVAEPVVKAPVVAEPVVEAPVVAEPVVEAAVVAEPVVEAPVVAEPVIAEPVVEAPVVAEPAGMAVEFDMPVFAMDTVAFESEKQEEVVEEVPEIVMEPVQEASADDVKLVVTDESAASVSTAEDFSMPTFAMDTVAINNVNEIFAEETVSEVAEEVVLNVEEQVEEVKEELIVTTDDAGSIAMTEEFSVPTFEMSSSTETIDVIEEISTETVVDTVEETVNEVAEEPVVVVQNPVFIKNPINFNRTRAYDATAEEHKSYGFEISEPTFETMGSFLADNKDNAFPEFETAQGAMDDFVSSFETATNEPETAMEAISETVIPTVETQVAEEIPAIESVAIDVSDNVDDVIEVNTESDAASIFEYASEDAGRIDDIEMPGFMASDYDSVDLFGTLSAGDTQEVEEAVKEMVVEPESVELGLDLGEEVSFGQTQSFAEWYDYDADPQPYVFDEPEEVVEAKTTEAVSDEEFDITKEYVYDYEAYEEEAEASDAEVVAPKVEAVSDDEFDITKEYIYDDDEYYDEEQSEETGIKTAAASDEFEVYDWDAADAAFTFEDEEEKSAGATSETTAKVDEDYFDWSSYDEYEFEDEEKKSSDDVVVNVSSDKKDDLYEEFVWTDEMIKAMEAEEAADNPEDAKKKIDDVVEDFNQAAEEVAASMEYDYVSDEPDQYEVFQSTGNFVPEVEEVVEEDQYKVFQSSGNFVPEVEEVVDETQYEVFQSSGNFVPEVEEVVEETQYEVFQSSGNFVPEVEEVVEETQYEVFQSSGNFVPEVEEVVEEIQYKTYGKDDEDDKNSSSKSSTDDDSDKSKGVGIDFPDFDLDLPNF